MMKPLQKMKWLLCAFALAVVLYGSNVQSQGAQLYMARAVLLEQSGTQYTVGVLYQDPEAAANSAEAQAPLKLAQGEGNSLAAAFQSLEQGLAAEVSYQLSDYLVLCGQCSKATVEEYAQQVQTTQRGRYSAQISYLSQDMAQLTQIVQETPESAELLLEALTLSEQTAPALYEMAQETLVMPLFSVQSDGVLAAEKTSYLLSTEGGTIYNDTQTQLYYLLSSAQGQASFLVGDVAFTIGGRLCSKSDVLTGVTDEISAVYSALKNQGDETIPTMRVYAIVSDASDTSSIARSNMEAYLEYCVNTDSALLAQLEVSRVEVHLLCLVDII